MLELLDAMSEATRQRVACHEAGHALARPNGARSSTKRSLGNSAFGKKESWFQKQDSEFENRVSERSLSRHSPAHPRLFSISRKWNSISPGRRRCWTTRHRASRRPSYLARTNRDTLRTPHFFAPFFKSFSKQHETSARVRHSRRRPLSREREREREREAGSSPNMREAR